MPQQTSSTQPQSNNGDEPDCYGWKQEARDLMKAIAAGSIVGMPLLYTMEMWWHGMTLSEWHLLTLLGVILLVNFVFNLLSGFRQEHSFLGALSEAITSVGIGIVFSAVVLWLIGELGWSVAPVEKAGKILLEALVVSVGVSFANTQVGGKSRTGDDGNGNGNGNGNGKEAGNRREAQNADQDGKGSQANGQANEQDEENDPERLQLQADLKEAGAALAGSTVFALNVAPTEEILMIAARLSPLQQLAMLGAAVLLCYIILFASGFEKHQVHTETVFQHPVAETLMTAALSLVVAFVLLLLVGQREAISHPVMAVAATVTLGLPAIVGGAAGRLIT